MILVIDINKVWLIDRSQTLLDLIHAQAEELKEELNTETPSSGPFPASEALKELLDRHGRRISDLPVILDAKIEKVFLTIL
jgi:hypothetical protein